MDHRKDINFHSQKENRDLRNATYSSTNALSLKNEELISGQNEKHRKSEELTSDEWHEKQLILERLEKNLPKVLNKPSRWAHLSNHPGPEFVIDGQHFPIEVGAPRRKVQFGKALIEIFADPNRRCILLDGQKVYAFGDYVRDVKLPNDRTGSRYPAFYHGAAIKLWIDGALHELRLDSPPKMITIKEKDHTIRIDGQDGKILLDNKKLDVFGGPARDVFIARNRCELRFEPPPRKIPIYGNLLELELDGKIPCVMIDGVPHGIRFDGPPRKIMVDDICYNVHMDCSLRIHIDDIPYYIAFGGPAHEVIFDGKWYEVKFDGPPKVIRVRNREVKIQLKGSTPDIKILEPLEDPQLTMPLNNVAFSSAGPNEVQGTRMRPAGPGNFQADVPIVNQGSIRPGEQTISNRKRNVHSDETPEVPQKLRDNREEEIEREKSPPGNRKLEGQDTLQEHERESRGEGSKESLQSSSSASDLIKRKASAFTNEDLRRFNVFYEEKPIEMNTFFEMVKSNDKNNAHRTGPEVEEIMKRFEQSTKKYLGKFVLDLDDLTKDKNSSKVLKKNELDKITMTYEEIDKFFGESIEENIKDRKKISLLALWKTAVTEFMKNCANVVHSILQPENNSLRPLETLYHDLFLSFSRIFLLHPRQQRKVCKEIGGYGISCVPDICFLQSYFSDHPQLVLVCEVKRKEPSKHQKSQKPTWIEKKIDSNTMGQIGVELLCESSGSVFTPNVAGIACLRSEIMFLFLEISEDHIQALNENTSLDEKHAKIHYTKTYDILKPEDRSKFVDILLYFAAIQSCNFIKPL